MGFNVLTKSLFMASFILTVITKSQSLDSDVLTVITESRSNSDSKSSSDNDYDIIPSSNAPTQPPSLAPSNKPSNAPSNKPSNAPSNKPSNAPSNKPSTVPSVCFGKTNEITTKRDGMIKNMRASDLLIGDQVYGRNIYNSSNGIEWSTIWYIDYHEMDSYISMINISYICDSMINISYHQYIVMVDYHLLYILDKHTNKEKMVEAGNIQMNDILLIYTDNNKNLFCRVNNIENTTDKPIYPLTMSGDIIVSNVIASSYIYSRQHALEKHAMAKSVNFNGSFPNIRRLVCFGKTNEMIIKRDDIVKKMKISELMEGDQVYARDIYNSSSQIEWSTVWYIDHHDTDPYEKMINISYVCDGNNIANNNYYQYVVMVEYHLLYILDENTNKQKMVQAGQVEINDILMIYTYNNNNLLCKVNGIQHTYDEPIFPVTISGDIIVSNVVVSSYIYSRQRALKMHGLAESVHFNGSLVRQLLSVYYT